MAIRLIALSIATADAWLLVFQQPQPENNTALYSTIIIAVVGLLTLIIQTYGQIQIKKIETKQNQQVDVVRDQTTKIKEQTDKIEKQSEKLEVVHTTVNSGRDRMIEKLEALVAKVNLLEGAAGERDKADAKALNQQVGAAQERVRADALVQSAPADAPAASDDTPAKVVIVGPDPLKVVMTDPESKGKD